MLFRSTNRKFIHDGDVEHGFGWAGQVMGLIKDAPAVDELIARIMAEAENIRLTWGK